MFSSKAFEAEGRQGALLLCQRPQPYAFRVVPDFPVMPETLLLVELKARERSVDLREISHVVLADIGASLQIMRRAASESTSCPDFPIRIEDCISQIGLQACIESLSQEVLTRGVHQAAIETWRHSRNIAESSALLAKDMGAGVRPEEAYLVGLFHELGSLPRILGWSRAIMTLNDEEKIGRRMAEECRLPQSVARYFSELGRSGSESPLAKIVRRAHERPNAGECLGDLSVMVRRPVHI